MKNTYLISLTLATLLLGTSALSANSYGDSVAQKETKAMNHPSDVKGHSRAKDEIKVQRAQRVLNANADTRKFLTDSQKEDRNRLQKIVSSELQKHKNLAKEAPKEVTDGLKQTIIALKALQVNNTKEAKKALQSASTMFDKAFKADPSLDFVPIMERVNVNDFSGDAKMVKHIVQSAQKLLKENDTQLAREILLPLQDEITIETRLLPMGAYPVAVKQALKDLNKGKKDLAYNDLAMAINSIVVETSVTPIPLLTAQELIMEASKLNKSQKNEASKLLALAQDELQKSVYLGYSKKHSVAYKSLENELSSIKKKVDGGYTVDKFYKHIKTSFENLLNLHKKEASKKTH